jgi:hypothetical protein
MKSKKAPIPHGVHLPTFISSPIEELRKWKAPVWFGVDAWSILTLVFFLWRTVDDVSWLERWWIKLGAMERKKAPIARWCASTFICQYHNGLAVEDPVQLRIAACVAGLPTFLLKQMVGGVGSEAMYKFTHIQAQYRTLKILTGSSWIYRNLPLTFWEEKLISPCRNLVWRISYKFGCIIKEWSTDSTSCASNLPYYRSGEEPDLFQRLFGAQSWFKKWWIN